MYIEEQELHIKSKILIVVLAVAAISLGAYIALNFSSVMQRTVTITISDANASKATNVTQIVSTVKPKANTTTTVQSTTTDSTIKTEVGRRLKVNDLVASSDSPSFGFFYTSVCYYTGRTYDYNVCYVATFSVIGSDANQGANAIYTFTVMVGGTFTLYGKMYRVSVPTGWLGGEEETSDIVVTQIS